jgi:DNA polymerase (family X)
MDKWQIARALDEIARYIELSDPNRFRAQAFERAARGIESLDRDVAQLVQSDELYKTPGIGKAIGPIITEIVKTGSSRYLEELREKYPPGIFELLRVPGLGLRKIGILHSELGIGSLDELEEACRSDRLVTLKGFGSKTQKKILDGIEFARRHESAFLLPVGLEIAEALEGSLRRIEGVKQLVVTGSVRRRLEVIHNVNFALASSDPAKTMKALERADLLDEFEITAPTTARGIARGEMAVVIDVAPVEEFGLLVLSTTGTREFVEAFLKKSASAGIAQLPNDEPALRKGKAKTRKPQGFNTEEEVFAAAGVPLVEPELRESAEPLLLKKRARLVAVEDLRGTFHVHTTWSDGRASVSDMLAAARERGYDYVGVSDHSKTAAYAGGLTVERLALQQAEIEKNKPDFAPMRVFKGSEADILTDGSIDYDDPTLASFDFIVASVHSRFNMDRAEMTERMLKALSNPFVTVLGHMTGRLLLSREGYTVDFNKVFDAAASRGVFIEINGNPNRLDLDWRHIRNALDRGVRFSINPDAHSVREMRYVLTGSWVARKGGLSPEHIFNAQPLEFVEEHLRKRRAAAIR